MSSCLFCYNTSSQIIIEMSSWIHDWLNDDKLNSRINYFNNKIIALNKVSTENMGCGIYLMPEYVKTDFFEILIWTFKYVKFSLQIRKF